MTTITAQHIPGFGTVLGSDKQISNDRRDFINLYPKWVIAKSGEWAIGVCGAGRTLHLINAHNEKLFHEVKNIYDLTNRMMELLVDDDTHFVREEGYPRHIAGSFLVATPDCVWNIDCSLTATEIPTGEFVSTGSGSEYALGAEFVAREHIKDPIEITRKAIEAAKKFDSGTGGDIWICKMHRVKHKNQKVIYPLKEKNKTKVTIA